MVNKNFIDVYGNVGYYLRNSDVETSSRIAMMSALVYLQQEQETPVKFKEFYDLSLEETNEKLEKGSFRNFVSKLHDERGNDKLIIEDKDDDGNTIFECSANLLSEIEQAASEFNSLMKK